MKTDCSFKDESGYNSNSNSNSNSNFNTKVLTRNCNKCNSVKPLTDFDESNVLVEIVLQLKLIVYIVVLL